MSETKEKKYILRRVLAVLLLAALVLCTVPLAGFRPQATSTFTAYEQGLIAAGFPEERLRPALQHLGCKLISVEDAARLCNLSSSRFAVLFKSVFGMSFARYERLFRLNGARDDMRHGSSLKEAAEKWNFCDKSHLARLLKKYW